MNEIKNENLLNEATGGVGVVGEVGLKGQIGESDKTNKGYHQFAPMNQMREVIGQTNDQKGVIYPP